MNQKLPSDSMKHVRIRVKKVAYIYADMWIEADTEEEIKNKVTDLVLEADFDLPYSEEDVSSLDFNGNDMRNIEIIKKET